MNRARQIRLDKGLTISAVSDATGVARKSIARLEDTGEEGHATTLKTLGDYYGVTASSLLLDATEEMAA